MKEFDRNELDGKLLKDFEQEDKIDSNISGNFSIKIISLILFMLIFFFITYSWYFDKFAISKKNNSDIILVKSDPQPVRVKPSDPGGMVIPDQDKTIFQTIESSSDELPLVTKILPMPEQPVSRDDSIFNSNNANNNTLDNNKSLDVLKNDDLHLFENLLTQTVENLDKENFSYNARDDKSLDQLFNPIDLENDLDDFSNDFNSNINNEKKQENSLNILEKINGKNNDAEFVSSSSVNENNSKDANNSLQFTDIRLVHKPSKEIKIPTINSTDKFYIQLGSYKSLKEIDKSWNNLQKKHSTLLGDLSYITKKADLGDKGVFYRLQAGPFLAESSARTLCKKLKELEQDCLFVK